MIPSGMPRPRLIFRALPKPEMRTGGLLCELAAEAMVVFDFTVEEVTVVLVVGGGVVVVTFEVLSIDVDVAEAIVEVVTEMMVIVVNAPESVIIPWPLSQSQLSPVQQYSSGVVQFDM